MVKRIVVGLGAVASIFATPGCDQPQPAPLPKFEVKKQSWLEQNWTPEQRSWFHHADQGTQTIPIPLEWLQSLKQPGWLFPDHFLNSEYLDRYGFISTSEQGPDSDLPVGFATGEPFRDPKGGAMMNPVDGKPWTRVGLTCAACHTGRVEYGDTAFLIDGAPAMTNLPAFQRNLGIALGMTLKLRWRFNAFADAVLHGTSSDEAKSALKQQVQVVLDQLTFIAQHEIKVAPDSVEEGYGRLDALTRIGNTVFALDMASSADKEVASLADKNYAPEIAPVHFPRIWDTFWFSWVQYNDSIQQPMVRNAGESLGVDAEINLVVPGESLFESDAKIDTISEMERQLSGPGDPRHDKAFHGLSAPRYTGTSLPMCANTEISGRDDTCKPVEAGDPQHASRVTHGKVLYETHCQQCHLPPITSEEFWSAAGWDKPDSMGGKFLDLEMVPIEHIGTDINQALGLQKRTVTVPSFLPIQHDSGGTASFGSALRDVVVKTVQFWYDRHDISQADRAVMDGSRPPGIRAELSYKVRPLDGVWATPPYLHNGSVPTVFDLLSPVSDRPQSVCMGTREYDPLRMGLKTIRDGDCPSGFTKLVALKSGTPVSGNSNAGHEFAATFDPAKGPNQNGAIGPALSVQDRLDLIEFLKSDETNGFPPKHS